MLVLSLNVGVGVGIRVCVIVGFGVGVDLGVNVVFRAITFTFCPSGTHKSIQFRGTNNNKYNIGRGSKY